jgi:predicted transcriptional regulator of viral defense system
MVTDSDTNSAQNDRKSLSKTESLLLSSLAEEGKKIFTLSDVTNKLENSYDNAKVIVNRLVKKKWLVQLAKGKYLIVPLEAGVRGEYTEHEFVIASYLVEQYYIGYWTALNYHGFTEQVPMTVFVVTTKRLRDRTILDIRYRFVALNKRKFFGFEAEPISNNKVNISDKEKTLADCLDHPEYCGGISEVVKSLWNAREEISIEKLVNYSVKMGNSAILKRLGFLVELLKIDISKKVMEKIRLHLKKGYVVLDPLERAHGNYSTRWALVINVSEDRLLEWRRGF